MAQTVTNTWVWKHLLSGRFQAYTLGLASMAALPHVTDPNKAIKTFVSEALHFRRGIRKYFLPRYWLCYIY